MKVRLLCAGLVLALSACTSVNEPIIQTGPDAEVIQGNLHRVDNSRAAIAYVNPNVDWSRYSRVMVDPLGVDNVEIIAPSTSSSVSSRSRNADWELSDRDKQSLEDAFTSAMKLHLEEKGDYPIVAKPGADVLRITAVLTALAPNAPADDSRSRSLGRGRVYTEGAGTFYISVSFSDSETGEVLALIKDQKEGSSTWGVNNRVTNLGEAKFVFNSWARSIRARLDIIRGY
jgi:hypothetical protein